MKRIIATGAVAALAMVGFAGTASAQGNGKTFQECFGASYGESGVQFGQFKKTLPDGIHDGAGPYGLPGVLAAHGPDGLAPLCSS